MCLSYVLPLLPSERSKLHRVLAVLSAVGLSTSLLAMTCSFLVDFRRTARTR